jgi:hypothetical protein
VRDSDSFSGGYAAVTLIGNDAANVLAGSPANDTIIGGAGSDSLYGGGGDDVLDSRDGYADRVNCADGTDTALTDQNDQVSASCESVQIAYTAAALEDRSPSIAWAAPAASTRLRAVVTTLRVTASDDRGVQSIRLLGDERVICTDTTAPYTCAYRPRASDVGRNTLVAVVTDTAGQTATAVRAVTVSRFTPRAVSLLVVKRGSRFTATGKVSLPAGLAAKDGCHGILSVHAKAAGKTIATRTDRIGRSCGFRVVFPARSGLKFTATYRGNDVIKPRKSATRGVRR